MRTLLHKLFLENWQRKLISLILAMIIWIVVHHSITSKKTIHNIPLQIKNIPQGKTVEGLQSNGQLSKKISLTLTGNKAVLDNLTSNDLKIVIDAKHKNDEWVVNIGKKNLFSYNPQINVSRDIESVYEIDFIVKLSKLVNEHIPLIITAPIGEAPQNYQFIDVFPYRLDLLVNGPEEIVKRLKMKGVKITFNLNEISTQMLDRLFENSPDQHEVSFIVPDEWKKIHIPSISEKPLVLKDPRAKNIRLDFLKTDLISINKPIQIQIFYPEKLSKKINPKTHLLKSNEFITTKNGLQIISQPLFAKGVSKTFVDIVKDHLQITAIADPKEKHHWHVQFVQPLDLENYYVDKMISQYLPPEQDLQPHLREEYLRSRFRTYMNKFRLYTANGHKLNLNIQIENQYISIKPDLSSN